MHYKFLIYISYSYSVPIGIPLEQEINRRGYTVKWFSDNIDGKNAIQDKNNTFESINEVIDYKPDVVLTATNIVPHFISGLKVQIFHGFLTYKRPNNKHQDSHFRIRGFFDLYCTQGPSTTLGFKKQQKKHPHFEIIETGWSKVDPLFPLPQKKLGEKPNIMIASTFTKHLSLALNESVFNEIKRLSRIGKFSFTMVLHPKLSAEVKNKWKSLNNTNFTFHDTTDLIPLFKKSDIMFADTTSAIQEYLLQKKPVVTFNHTFNHDYLINITNSDDIEKSIENALTYPSKLIKNITNFVNQLHPYSDGKSSERIINASISFFHNDKKHLKKKPMNLIRKFKIRKTLQYFKL